jgi:anti-sigma-K factor RskA
VTSIDENRVILVAEDMPSVPENRTCQIWVMHDEGPTPSGLLDPDGNMTVAPVTTSIEKADAIAVTVEPAGGSEKIPPATPCCSQSSSDLPSNVPAVPPERV